MVYWICPECGHECSPAIRECPTCSTPPLGPPAAAVTLCAAQPEAPQFSLSALPVHIASPALAVASAPLRARFVFKLADLVPGGELRPKPSNLARQGSPEPLQYEPPRPVFIRSQISLASESLGDAAIAAIQASFREQPALCLLTAPEEVVMAPAPPIGQWMRQPRVQLTPVPPENAGRATLTAGPQAPTLAGPSLPQLRNFMEDRNSSRGSHRKRSTVPAWLIALVVAIVLVFSGASLVQYWTSSHTGSASSAKAPLHAASPPLPLRVVEEHPAARSVEVAGVRIVTGINKRPQLQYVVINHSANELTGLNIRIAVRSVDALAGTPLLSVSSIVPSLGPSQSKEIRADLDAAVKPGSIPDWQSLRTEVLIARQ